MPDDSVGTNTMDPAAAVGDGDGTGGDVAASTNGTGTQESKQPENFEQWLAAQPDAVQGMFEDHVAGLKSALSTERDNRKSLQKTVKDLQATAGKAEDLQERLQALEAQLTEQGNYAQFVEAAATVGVKNIRLAWLAVKEFGLLSDSGEVDMDDLKAKAPELFGKTVAMVSAGAGSAQPPKAAPSMNDLIRSAAGRNR